MVNAFLDELEHLQQSTPTNVSTTLLVFNKCQVDFLDFSDFVGLCEELLEEAGLLEHFQLVTFHPGFYFENTNEDDVENFVNRSPYPIIHILRNAEIEMAKSRSTGLDISLKNSEKLKSLSTVEIQKLYFYLQ